jgi:hypothetical protein
MERRTILGAALALPFLTTSLWAQGVTGETDLTRSVTLWVRYRPSF